MLEILSVEKGIHLTSLKFNFYFKRKYWVAIGKS